MSALGPRSSGAGLESEEARSSAANIDFGPTDGTDAGKPALSEGVRRRIRELAEGYPERRTALLPALKLAQAEVGYLPAAVVAQVADEVRIPHAAAQELVSFYTMLLPEKLGRTVVVVCGQLPCALNGSQRLLQDLSTGLGIAPGATTEDGAVTLERTSECFGACHRAPMARVNETYYENLNAEATRALLSEIGDRRVSGRSGGLGELPHAEEKRL